MGNDNDTVKREALEYGKRNVACSGRHIYEHIVNLVPYHVGPKLLCVVPVKKERGNHLGG